MIEFWCQDHAVPGAERHNINLCVMTSDRGKGGGANGAGPMGGPGGGPGGGDNVN